MNPPGRPGPIRRWWLALMQAGASYVVTDVDESPDRRDAQPASDDANARATRDFPPFL